MVIEQAEAAANDSSWSNGPGETNARLDVVSLLESRIVVPANTTIEREVMPYLPVILEPQAVVIVAQPDLIRLWRQTADGSQEKEAGVYGTELEEIGLCGEKLVELCVGFISVHLGAFEVPPKLEGMPVKTLRETRAERSILLGEVGRSQLGAKAELTQIAEDAARCESAEQIEKSIGARLGMSGTRQSGFAAILTSGIEDEGAGLVAEGYGIREAEQQIAITEVGARRGKASGSGERIRAVDMDVGVVHLLGEVMRPEALVKLGENARLTIRCGLVKRLLTV